jgi:hypothetical protein
MILVAELAGPDRPEDHRRDHSQHDREIRPPDEDKGPVRAHFFPRSGGVNGFLRNGSYAASMPFGSIPESVYPM